jgi:hypothetical protein
VKGRGRTGGRPAGRLSDPGRLQGAISPPIHPGGTSSVLEVYAALGHGTVDLRRLGAQLIAGARQPQQSPHDLRMVSDRTSRAGVHAVGKPRLDQFTARHALPATRSTADGELVRVQQHVRIGRPYLEAPRQAVQAVATLRLIRRALEPVDGSTSRAAAPRLVWRCGLRTLVRTRRDHCFPPGALPLAMRWGAPLTVCGRLCQGSSNYDSYDSYEPSASRQSSMTRVSSARAACWP